MIGLLISILISNQTNSPSSTSLPHQQQLNPTCIPYEHAKLQETNEEQKTMGGVFALLTLQKEIKIWPIHGAQAFKRCQLALSNH